ncbi:YihY/virulence factor BrkB family protein [Cryobacterium tepidiphilum]|uniref:YihY/virulence factor BrkB family protein n=1 Tax=Cryobacterium tepidiphilum TaxID=2486026 RepID=UPI0018F3FAC3|nr:YihY/virulence factor BrkB family protein [Cryobacterium tepidiphilum]
MARRHRPVLRGIVAAVPVVAVVTAGIRSLKDTGQTGPPPGTAADPTRRKPSSPTKLHAPTWHYILRQTLHEFGRDSCTDLAATLTYYMVLSLFPGLLALVSLLGIVGQAQQTTDALLRVVEQLAPGDTVGILRDTVQQFTESPATGFTLVIGILGALWSASGYVGAFGRAMNRIYETREGRPVWVLRPVQLLVTITAMVLVIVIATILIISGPIAQAIGNVVGLGETSLLIWSIAKWPVLAAAVILMVAVLYYATPNVRQPHFRWVSLGSILAVLVLGVATLGFGFYVSNFANYDRTYGSLGGVIVFLLWLWIANLALLFGAEFDSELERGRELQGGIRAEENLRLETRDRQQIVKADLAEAGDVRDGRILRLSRGRSRP